ncbi:hypothetical protein PVAP13_8KG374302 [Panicum virgatum]|uniref:Uncharacterized protein n=1 Tax=Panicum virgatum TaxID=38727 RepID=A0A8T0PNI5_PANVG|nr:hypothetical protein PVAP13_8KG374302 [Panicum virgatum]
MNLAEETHPPSRSSASMPPSSAQLHHVYRGAQDPRPLLHQRRQQGQELPRSRSRLILMRQDSFATSIA